MFANSSKCCYAAVFTSSLPFNTLGSSCTCKWSSLSEYIDLAAVLGLTSPTCKTRQRCNYNVIASNILSCQHSVRRWQNIVKSVNESWSSVIFLIFLSKESLHVRPCPPTWSKSSKSSSPFPACFVDFVAGECWEGENCWEREWMERDLGEGVAGPSESISVATGLAGVRGAAVTATCLLQLLLGLLGVGRSLKVGRSGLQTLAGKSAIWRVDGEQVWASLMKKKRLKTRERRKHAQNLTKKTAPRACWSCPRNRIQYRKHVEDTIQQGTQKLKDKTLQ